MWKLFSIIPSKYNPVQQTTTLYYINYLRWNVKLSNFVKYYS